MRWIVDGYNVIRCGRARRPEAGRCLKQLVEQTSSRIIPARRSGVNDSEVEVTAFEAKTRLSELLREAERGRSFVIRRRGKPVARLVPFVQDRLTADPSRILKAFREVRSRLSGPVKVRQVIDEVRRF
jgi:prevent-host-death family protein